MMLYDCAKLAERDRGLTAAVEAVKRGDLVVFPTDTVYGIGCDAFKSWSVGTLLRAKSRGRDVPPPVMVGSRQMLDGLVYGLPSAARDLVEAFWPGPLTILVEHAPSLDWDLGDTDGVIQVRMPLHPVALELIRETGPMAVSSANKPSDPAALTADEARTQFGYEVSVYLEAGAAPEQLTSTIVDCTNATPKILRVGALSLAQLREVAPDVAEEDE
ncbi:tRNA threonylcarbamoyl adenosine modification protein (Sua5/YciO/YrdC/YwlC family) [Longispora fulva]|uniref:L-threonylcarbamoyladenylate synthase n=2 Tax=Longispora fulva TaxID=619741 RepID=A0A8J7KJX1_9ACTN|nr:tRNA threonylcarbamoyl adenosine modification protein (Sua5/YciO/YrdC/YwlC family) [Longispora fulva]